MKNVDYFNKWENLELEVTKKKNAKIVFADNIGNNGYLSIDENLKKILYIEFAENELINYSLSQINGIKIEMTKNYNINPTKIYLKLINIDNLLQEAFVAFTTNILQNIESCKTDKETIIKVEETILDFKKFFSTTKKFSKEEEQGLVAELLFLSEVIDLKMENINSWYGPNNNKRDFIFSDKAIEIKSSRNQTQKIISVSNENQLCYEKNYLLYMRLYVLEERDNGYSISGLIGEIMRKLQGTYRKIFSQKLIQLGIDINIYESNYYFEICDIFDYEINQEFPTVKNKELDNRIYDIKYKINLSTIDVVKLKLEDLK